MLIQQILLAAAGISAGVAVAGGLFAFIVELGVIAGFADRTHTADKILFYEDCAAFGGIVGNLVTVFHTGVRTGVFGLGIFGIFAGIFTGCWAMALAEILNVFPVFTRRIGVKRCLSVLIISLAAGKGLGACLFFFEKW